MNSDGFFTTEGLTKVYSSGLIQVVALADVSLSVAEGEFLGVAGPSGSGKSTLMNLLGGLDTPSSGSIKVQGKLVSELNKEELALYRRHLSHAAGGPCRSGRGTAARLMKLIVDGSTSPSTPLRASAISP